MRLEPCVLGSRRHRLVPKGKVILQFSTFIPASLHPSPPLLYVCPNPKGTAPPPLGAIPAAPLLPLRVVQGLFPAPFAQTWWPGCIRKSGRVEAGVLAGALDSWNVRATGTKKNYTRWCSTFFLSRAKLLLM